MLFAQLLFGDMRSPTIVVQQKITYKTDIECKAALKASEAKMVKLMEAGLPPKVKLQHKAECFSQEQHDDLMKQLEATQEAPKKEVPGAGKI